MYLWNQNGDRLIDGSSGLFNVAAGHGRREIADAVHAQMLQNDYTAPFQLGQPGLASRSPTSVAGLLPEPFNHVFFANSGSEAIDTALKMAMAYHRARGEAQRLRFVSRERAYHGVNIGGVSLSGMVAQPRDLSGRHARTSSCCATPGTRRRPSPAASPSAAPELADDLQRFCETYGGATIAAVFVEPVAGSTGMLVPPKGYLERLRAICDRHGILLVFDEVITGFGRLGAPFAAQAFGVMPDIITMAKALTNGAIPMGAVAARDEIYETITGAAPENAIEFFHGYTYSGHPAACAAGLATLDIYEDEGLFERAAGTVALLPRRDLVAARPAAVRDLRGYRPDGRRRGPPRGRQARRARHRAAEAAVLERLPRQVDRRHRDRRAGLRRRERAAHRRHRRLPAPDDRRHLIRSPQASGAPCPRRVRMRRTRYQTTTITGTVSIASSTVSRRATPRPAARRRGRRG